MDLTWITSIQVYRPKYAPFTSKQQFGNVGFEEKFDTPKLNTELSFRKLTLPFEN